MVHSPGLVARGKRSIIGDGRERRCWITCTLSRLMKIINKTSHMFGLTSCTGQYLTLSRGIITADRIGDMYLLPPRSPPGLSLSLVIRRVKSQSTSTFQWYFSLAMDLARVVLGSPAGARHVVLVSRGYTRTGNYGRVAHGGSIPFGSCTQHMSGVTRQYFFTRSMHRTS